MNFSQVALQSDRRRNEMATGDAAPEIAMANKLVRLLSCVATIGVFANSHIALAQPTSGAAQSGRDGSHDMDFSLGQWRTDITSFKDPFNHPDEASHMSGTKTVRPLWNGTAVIEE